MTMLRISSTDGKEFPAIGEQGVAGRGLYFDQNYAVYDTVQCMAAACKVTCLSGRWILFFVFVYGVKPSKLAEKYVFIMLHWIFFTCFGIVILKKNKWVKTVSKDAQIFFRMQDSIKLNVNAIFQMNILHTTFFFKAQVLQYEYPLT